MLKYLVIALALMPSSSLALTNEESCRIVAEYSHAIASAKEYGLEYDNAIDWVADLPYRKPWSDMLAFSVEQMYSDSQELQPQQRGIIIYLSCLSIVEEQQ
jgi:hypothetical protein